MIASIVQFVRLLVSFLKNSISLYIQTPAGFAEANAVVQAWDALDGKDDIPDWFSENFPAGDTPTPKNPQGSAPGRSGEPYPANDKYAKVGMPRTPRT